ncbi:MAG: hypothetical protein ACRD9S_18675 [Pyrinomonadaceae bacterium]
MSDEEMNKKMEFIVEQQAKFAAEIEIMREVQATDAKQMRELSSAVITVIGLVGDLTETQTRTDEQINRLAQAQARTDERLNVFINVVERYIGGNGGAESLA